MSFEILFPFGLSVFELQVLGIGTALRILISSGEDEVWTLQRNEAIALVNTLAQLSTSVRSVQLWRRRELTNALAGLLGDSCSSLPSPLVSFSFLLLRSSLISSSLDLPLLRTMS